MNVVHPSMNMKYVELDYCAFKKGLFDFSFIILISTSDFRGTYTVHVFIQKQMTKVPIKEITKTKLTEFKLLIVFLLFLVFLLLQSLKEGT